MHTRSQLRGWPKAWFVGGLVAVLCCGAVPATPGANSAADPDACALLAPAEIRTALGVDPGSPVGAQVGVGARACHWPRLGSAGENLVYVIVAPRSVGTWEALQASLRGSFGELDRLELESGVGDFAAWVSLDGEPAALQVYAGRYFLQIGVSAPAALRATAINSLATQALGRLRPTP